MNVDPGLDLGEHVDDAAAFGPERGRHHQPRDGTAALPAGGFPGGLRPPAPGSQSRVPPPSTGLPPSAPSIRITQYLIDIVGIEACVKQVKQVGSGKHFEAFLACSGIAPQTLNTRPLRGRVRRSPFTNDGGVSVNTWSGRSVICRCTSGFGPTYRCRWSLSM